ncbi:hypothetical protein AX16_002697 [Volvariella volvacea WC 439]|nr:hypothetical protein AX16_002697 [Volvariella volvacea WC 439]
MSFSGTPLGQGRRLDHSSFLGKPSSNINRAPSPNLTIPSSYAYNATRPQNGVNQDSHTDSATSQFAKSRPRGQPLSRTGGPRVVTDHPNPESWVVKDTTVNIATAFNQATSNMQAHNPNNAWATGANRPNSAIPRSTSVEYEEEAAKIASRRFAAPAPRHRGSRPPVSKSASSHNIPEAEEEERPDRNARGKSPIAHVMEAAKRVIGQATYYAQEPMPQEQPTTNGNDSSYDYNAEELEYQAKNAKANRRKRMSTDNKAYKPSASSEEDDDELDDDDKRPRRKATKGSIGGPLTHLPNMGKMGGTKKRKVKSGKGDLQEEERPEGVSGDENVQEITQTAAHSRAPSASKTSAPAPSRGGSVPPQPVQEAEDDSVDVEQGLDSIPEMEEEDVEEQAPKLKSRGPTPARAVRPWSIGGFLGIVVNWMGQLFISSIYVAGRTVGIVWDVIQRIRRLWSRRSRQIVAAVVVLAISWLLFRLPLSGWLPSQSKSLNKPVYTAPNTPVTNLEEFSARLQELERSVSLLSTDLDRTRVKADNEARNQAEVAGRLGALETRVQSESRRFVEAEIQLKNHAAQNLRALKQDVELLQIQVQAQQQQQQQIDKRPASGADNEARARLRALEERIGTVENDVREALELGKKGGGMDAAWWHKLASGANIKDLVIKSSSGQDVTAIISQLVEDAVTVYNKDILARPDFALYSAGARIIPSLTSPTYEIQPSGFKNTLRSLVTGNGYAIGRAPVTAIHHDTHSGLCWPIPGVRGQLGVALAQSVRITDFTIEHVAKEVAFDMRSAPRDMEVWALVEGDNIDKVKQWQTEKAKQREQAIARGEQVEAEPTYPTTLPTDVQYIRIANFTFDAHSSKNIQTFPVSPDVKDLDTNFNIVVLLMKNNWGQDTYTCLYRFRVHGQRVDAPSLPTIEELTSPSPSS